MAKYEVHFSCGHTDVVQLFGPEKDRRRKIEWYENFGKCPECYAKSVDAKNADGCIVRMMLYKEYKEQWYWCKTVRDSYDDKQKTIGVYIPESYVDLEEYVYQITKNGHDKDQDEAYKENVALIKSAMDSGEIDKEQVKALVKLARQIYWE